MCVQYVLYLSRVILCVCVCVTGTTGTPGALILLADDLSLLAAAIRFMDFPGNAPPGMPHPALQVTYTHTHTHTPLHPSLHPTSVCVSPVLPAVCVRGYKVRCVCVCVCVYGQVLEAAWPVLSAVAQHEACMREPEVVAALCEVYQVITHTHTLWLSHPPMLCKPHSYPNKVLGTTYPLQRCLQHVCVCVCVSVCVHSVPS